MAPQRAYVQVDPEPIIDESLIVARTRAGDPAALGELYARHARALLALADRLLGDNQAAEDVVHDVFLGLPEALRHYHEQGALLSWLKRITARVALNYMRSHRRRAELPFSAAGEIAVRQTNPVDAMALSHAIAALPESLRTVFVLKDIEGFAHTEIASMLDITRGASEVRHHRAVRALRTMLESSR